jgi:hypothetical protein
MMGYLSCERCGLTVSESAYTESLNCPKCASRGVATPLRELPLRIRPAAGSPAARPGVADPSAEPPPPPAAEG